ncbi:MAG: di-trans,poly-cis-decaprenylcistransferase [Synergistaceae bacterium]|nr:di-trans,poly-cis-decaprenylcistransferase [Synergistaceae bacterium]
MAGNDKNNANIPEHVAIIMDGNGRWAKKRGLARIMGHRAGMKAVEEIVNSAFDLGIKYLSLYAFSTENWKRLPTEIEGLRELFRFYLINKIEKMYSRGVRIRFAGRIGAFGADILEHAKNAEEYTKENTNLEVVFCVNYGGRQEIVDAVNKLLLERTECPITEESLRSRMYLPDVPDPDLLIRTGGELRMSNFLLWESAYSEYYFTEVYWPDFNEAELENAILDYSRRERRYGVA